MPNKKNKYKKHSEVLVFFVIILFLVIIGLLISRYSEQKGEIISLSEKISKVETSLEEKDSEIADLIEESDLTRKEKEKLTLKLEEQKEIRDNLLDWIEVYKYNAKLNFYCYDKGIDFDESYCNEFTVCNNGCDYPLITAKSMYPTFNEDDLLRFCANPDKEDIQLCDIIMYRNPEYDRELKYIIHRVVDITGDGTFITKGDSQQVDDYIIDYSDIIGKLKKIEYQ